MANFGNSLDVGFRFEEATPEVNENFSYNLAKHALKFGGSIRAIRDTQVQATAALYTFPNIAAYVAARDGLNTRTYASFIQTVGEPSMAIQLALQRSLRAGHLEAAGEHHDDVWRAL